MTTTRLGLALVLGTGAACVSVAVVAVWASRRRRRHVLSPREHIECERQLPIKMAVPQDFDGVGRVDRVLRKAETVLARRTSMLLVVIERSRDTHNHSAVLRTAEAFGVQNVWVIDPPKDVGLGRKRGVTASDMEAREQHGMFAKRAQMWLTVRNFATTHECISALRNDGRTIWATDLSQHADVLSPDAPWFAQLRLGKRLPKRLALVLGSESTGISDTMRDAADRTVYLPLHGFADSLNLSVAAALCMQFCLQMYGSAALGKLDDGETERLRKQWYEQLARNPEQKDAYARRLASPPPPFDDMRRAELHRTAFIKKSKRRGDGK